MYQPAHFVETRTEILHALVREYPLATLVTMGSDGLDANHIPLVLDPDPAPNGTLRGHVARANPVWREFSDAVDALAVFHGADAYISPSWYAAKQEHGRVVPTWNYAVVHATGPLRVVDDAEWLRGLVERLTRQLESPRSQPWHVNDAPAEYIDAQLHAVIGIEIPIRKLTGKWKASQNRPAADREGVVAGLGEHPMAHLVRDRRP